MIEKYWKVRSAKTPNRTNLFRRPEFWINAWCYENCLSLTDKHQIYFVRKRSDHKELRALRAILAPPEAPK